MPTAMEVQVQRRLKGGELPPLLDCYDASRHKPTGLEAYDQRKRKSIENIMLKKVKRFLLRAFDVVLITWAFGFFVCIFAERYPYYEQGDYGEVEYERISFQSGLDDDYTPVIHSKPYGDNCDKSIYLSKYLNTIDTRLLRASVEDIEKNGFTFRGYFGKYCYWERSEGPVDAKELKRLNFKVLRFELLMGSLLLVWPIGRYIRNNYIVVPANGIGL